MDAVWRRFRSTIRVKLREWEGWDGTAKKCSEELTSDGWKGQGVLRNLPESTGPVPNGAALRPFFDGKEVKNPEKKVS